MVRLYVPASSIAGLVVSVGILQVKVVLPLVVAPLPLPFSTTCGLVQSYSAPVLDAEDLYWLDIPY